MNNEKTTTTSVTNLVRKFHNQGMTRSEIAKAVSAELKRFVRYQHVNNTLARLKIAPNKAKNESK